MQGPGIGKSYPAIHKILLVAIYAAFRQDLAYAKQLLPGRGYWEIQQGRTHGMEGYDKNMVETVMTEQPQLTW